MKTFSFSVCLFAVATAVAGCASTPTLRLTATDELVAAHELANDGRSGDVWLHWRYQARVDASNRPGGATSEIRLVAALTRFVAGGDAPEMTVCVPRNAGTPTLSAQTISTTATTPPRTPAITARRAAAAPCLDPGQSAWAVRPEVPTPGDITEISLVFAVPGTLNTDLQPLSPPSGRLVEGLWRFDLPGDGVGALATNGIDASPITADQAGRRVHAIFARDLVARPPRDAYLRFATRSVSPVGNTQDFASDWAVATAPYVAGLVAPSATLTDGYAVPFTPTGETVAERVASAVAWVAARPLAKNGLDAPWSDARPLPRHLSANTLTATDKAHLLAWILRDAGIPFRYAIARPGAPFAPVLAAFPQPNAFTTPLVAVTLGDTPLLLDPACETCETGAVRPALANGQALLLPFGNPSDLLDIP